MKKIDLRIVLGLLGGIVLVVAIWYFALWKSRQSQIASAQASVAAAQSHLSEEQTLLQESQSPSSKVSGVQAQAGLLAQAIPAGVDLAGIINDVYTAATLAGISISSLGTPVPTAGAGASGSAQAEHLTISTSGRYFQIVDFVDQLQQLPRLYVVTSLTLSGGQSSQANAPNTLFTPNLSASIAVSTFYSGAAPTSGPSTSGGQTGPSTPTTAPSVPTTASATTPASTTTTAGVGTAPSTTSSVP